MPSRRVLFSLACIFAAVVLAGPATVAYLRYRIAMGDIREVVVTPLGDGHARLGVLYDFSVGGSQGPQGDMRGGITWLAWGQDGGWFTPADDPVLPLAEAHARAQRLRALVDDGKRRRLFRVFYRANDPSGSAFIQLGDGGGSTAYLIGMLCVFISLLVCLTLPRRPRPGTAP